MPITALDNIAGTASLGYPDPRRTRAGSDIVGVNTDDQSGFFDVPEET